MGFGYSQIGKQMRNQLRFHAGAAVCMDRELARCDILFVTAFIDKLSGQGILLTMSNHPAHHITAEDIQYHIQVEVIPLGRAF